MGRQYAFDDLIAEAAARHQVEPALLKAIVWQESRFDPTKLHDGGCGLMQIGKGTAMEWAAVHRVESFMMPDLFDARTNLQAGAWYVRQLLDCWRDANDPTMFALAEYVAGREALQQWTGGSVRAETLRAAMEGTAAGQFVDRVLKRMRTVR
jgi:soluble lytic murein transglycosylase